MPLKPAGGCRCCDVVDGDLWQREQTRPAFALRAEQCRLSALGACTRLCRHVSLSCFCRYFFGRGQEAKQTGVENEAAAARDWHPAYLHLQYDPNVRI